jgi:glycosyltransferase involved in cell wall biosynthesis
MLTVTTIVPTFNRVHFLKLSLDSILGQTRAPDQVIVVNDGSTDDTADFVRSYGDRVELINRDNGGKSAAVNGALSSARGDLIWIFDDDDIAFPDALERHAGVHEAHPEIGYSYSSFVRLLTDADGTDRIGEELVIPEMQPDEIHYHLQEGCLINQQGMVLKKNCFAEVGGLRADLLRAEDYEFFLRLSRRRTGWRKAGPSYYFRDHAGARGAGRSSHATAERERHFFHYEQRFWRDTLPAYALAEFLPRAARSEPLSVAARREALVRRTMVAARNGLPEQFLSDLDEMAALPEWAPLNRREMRSAERAFSRPEAVLYLVDHPMLDRICGALGQPKLREVALAFAAGLAYARRDLGEVDRRVEQTFAQLSRRFTGALGGARIFSYKLRKRLRAR